jgi:hypothetical protein
LWLNGHIAARKVSCVDHGKDRYGRTLAICSAGGEDLNAWVVRKGFALAYVQYSRAYAHSQPVTTLVYRYLYWHVGEDVAHWWHDGRGICKQLRL